MRDLCYPTDNTHAERTNKYRRRIKILTFSKHMKYKLSNLLRVCKQKKRKRTKHAHALYTYKDRQTERERERE